MLDATAALIRRVREVVPGYSDRKCASRTDEVALLLRYARAQLVERRFDSRARGLAIPDWDEDGPIHIISIDRGTTRADAAFTVRHELSHVLSGEADEAVLLTEEDTMSYSERRADLFAVADLVPAGIITIWRRGPNGGVRPWKTVTLEVAHAFHTLTGWTLPRIWDRAKLRLRLYREYGL